MAHIITIKPQEIKLDYDLPSVATTAPQQHANLISGAVQLHLTLDAEHAKQLPIIAALQLQVEAQAVEFRQLQVSSAEHEAALKKAHEEEVAALREQLGWKDEALDELTAQVERLRAEACAAGR